MHASRFLCLVITPALILSASLASAEILEGVQVSYSEHLVGNTPNRIRFVNDMMYLGTNHDLSWFDCSNPAQLHILDSEFDNNLGEDCFDLNEEWLVLSVEQEYLALAEMNDGVLGEFVDAVQIISASDPILQDNLVFISWRYGLKIFQITNGGSLEELSDIPASYTGKLFLEGTTLAYALGDTCSFWDVSDPASPAHLATWGFESGSYPVRSLAFIDGYIYTLGQGGIRVFDGDVETDQLPLATIPISATVNYSPCLETDSTHLFVALFDTLYSFEIADPITLNLSDQVAAPEDHYFADLNFRDGTLFVAQGGAYGETPTDQLHTYSVSEDGQLQTLGVWGNPGVCYSTDLYGEFLYTYGEDVLSTWEYEDGAYTHLQSQSTGYDLYNGRVSVAQDRLILVGGGIATWNTFYEGVLTYDLTDPASVSNDWSMNWMGREVGVDISEGTVYVLSDRPASSTTPTTELFMVNVNETPVEPSSVSIPYEEDVKGFSAVGEHSVFFFRDSTSNEEFLGSHLVEDGRFVRTDSLYLNGDLGRYVTSSGRTCFTSQYHSGDLWGGWIKINQLDQQGHFGPVLDSLQYEGHVNILKVVEGILFVMEYLEPNDMGIQYFQATGYDMNQPDHFEQVLFMKGTQPYSDIESDGSGTFVVSKGRSFDIFTATDVGVVDHPLVAAQPQEFSITSAYPNPFNASCVVQVSTPTSADVSLEIYNIVGQHVATLFDGQLHRGQHHFSWNPEGVSAGIYFAILKTNGTGNNIRKLVHVK